MAVKGKKDKAEEKKFYISVCVKGAEEIRKLLKMDDPGYFRYSVWMKGGAREFYLYSILDELEKAGVSLTLLESLIKGKPVKDPKGENRLTRNLLSAFIDQQMIWDRKLTEILTELVLFQGTNTEDQFRHYLLVKQLDELRKVIDDTNEYFGNGNENHKFQCEELRREIQALESSSIQVSSCWYLPNNQSGTRGRFDNFKEVAKKAFFVANKEQKLALGSTYGTSFTKSSQSLHPNLVNPDEGISQDQLEANFGHIGLLATHILLICRKLLKDKRRKGLVAQLSSIIRNNKYPKELFKSRVNPSIKVGDFVIAYGDIAEVIKIKKTKYGYRSFTVKYLTTPPLPQIPIDHFPAMLVKKFGDKQTLVKDLKQKIKSADPLHKFSNKRMLDSLRISVGDMWEKFGYKELAYGRPDLAKKKIEEYIKAQKDVSSKVS